VFPAFRGGAHLARGGARMRRARRAVQGDGIQLRVAGARRGDGGPDAPHPGRGAGSRSFAPAAARMTEPSLREGNTETHPPMHRPITPFSFRTRAALSS